MSLPVSARVLIVVSRSTRCRDGNLVRRDHVGGPGLDRAEGTTLDAWHLDIAGDRIARHAQMMFERGLGRVFDDLRRSIQSTGQ